MTPARRKIVLIFQAAKTPLSAQDILGIYNQKSDSPKPLSNATLYRTINILEKIRFIHKLKNRAKNRTSQTLNYYEL